MPSWLSIENLTFSREINIAISALLVLTIFILKNVWADLRLKSLRKRLQESQAKDRQKANSIHLISQEEYEYQSNEYTNSQLQKLFKDPAYKDYMSKRSEMEAESEFEVNSDGEGNITRLFDKLFKVDQKLSK